MLKNKGFIIFFIIFLVGVFIYGLAKLLLLRFEAGDVYPPYSSLRTDPLGTKIFYEGLDNLDSVSIDRNYNELSMLVGNENKTIFYFGLSPANLKEFDVDSFRALETLVSTGSRCVISFYPMRRKDVRSSIFKSEDTKTGENGGDENDSEKLFDKENESRKLKEKARKLGLTSELHIVNILSASYWNIKFEYIQLSKADNTAEKSENIKNASLDILPESISWHSGLVFKDIDPLWQIIYEYKNKPVIIERKFGTGSIVISTDSYFVSNEAMRVERHPPLLAWLIGDKKKIICDETHLGVQKNPGIGTIARNLRLHGLLAAIMVLAVLFIWKNASSFIPPHDDEELIVKDLFSEGKDYSAGLTNLLRRNIPQADIIQTCYKEWKKSCLHDRWNLMDKLNRIEKIVKSENARSNNVNDIVSSYKRICRILDKRR
ncbi:MAG: hypothetical protein A2161_19755 [Candidatus Schekmanbacteria bacterium RBG_13_48_7]|uniref:DUF4350 domain-containing protein n=1 Tax=Candidatus Schekmanbacteria bacterium RBG_13_48_7 TaxID=1817878 RepID=A0A1F7S1G8_9BACT|nr:MAG: hypothetical protein A2161_19755 [Candidatus Schekmanbacteria bacterium RBG_13_48_7]